MTKTFGRLIGAAALLAAGPAMAHHPLAGAPMETFQHGLLSGIGHPILGFDHLFFVIAVGIAAVFTGRALTAPLGFLGGMAAGVVLCASGMALPMVEPMIALSLLVLGAIVLSGRALGFGAAMALFAGTGLFHGWAFGESIAAQESFSGIVFAGYMIGLTAVQWLVAIAAGALATRLWQITDAGALRPRLAGAMVAGIGCFLVLESVEGAAFAAFGIS